MRKNKEIQEQVLTCSGRYREVHPLGNSAKDPSPLKVKEVRHMDRRYIVCVNERQAAKDKATRADTIRGHVFCSFLALVLRKELERRLEQAGHVFEWAHIKQDLKALQETHIAENGTELTVRSPAQGVCGKVFQAVGVAMPATIREISANR